jgi:cyanophycinase
VDPSAKGFVGFYDSPGNFYFPDLLASGAIYKAMVRALDSKAGVVKGLAFAQPAGGKKNDLGFEFRVYRGRDTVGWDTSSGGHEIYSVLNVYVDITPVKLASPLYTPLGK